MIHNLKLFIMKKFYKIRFKEKVKIKKKFDEINRASKHNIIRLCFGEKNKNKNFFIIKRTPGGGFFSNFIFVLKCLEFAYSKKFIPHVDMENFPTNYNQLKNMNNIKNVWDLYFKNLSNYKLDEIYQSKNVFFSKTRFKTRLRDYNSAKLKKLYLNKININDKIYEEAEKFYEKNFKKKYVVGIHLRGTDQKITPGHHLPPTVFDIKVLINKLIKKKKNLKIFLVTEQLKYYKDLTKNYKKYISAYQSFRADNVKDFNNCERKNHRNKLGKESLIEAIILSKCKQMIYCKSNIPLFSIFISKNKIKKSILDYGINSSNPMIAFFKWYVKILPISYCKYLIYKIHINFK
tara:strand:- start:907 stop:1950 length:1044 start_codon:yes stop_codon:yes gene_type:complete